MVSAAVGGGYMCSGVVALAASGPRAVGLLEEVLPNPRRLAWMRRQHQTLLSFMYTARCVAIKAFVTQTLSALPDPVFLNMHGNLSNCPDLPFWVLLLKRQGARRPSSGTCSSRELHAKGHISPPCRLAQADHRPCLHLTSSCSVISGPARSHIAPGFFESAVCARSLVTSHQVAFAPTKRSAALAEPQPSAGTAPASASTIQLFAQCSIPLAFLPSPRVVSVR